MNKIHFHIWKEIKISNVSLKYRYCNCGKWQKNIISNEKTWWEICEKPDNIENKKEDNIKK